MDGENKRGKERARGRSLTGKGSYEVRWEMQMSDQRTGCENSSHLGERTRKSNHFGRNSRREKRRLEAARNCPKMKSSLMLLSYLEVRVQT